MTGAEHYREAERLLEASRRHTDQGNRGDEQIATHTAAQAQVHATLALTAVTAETGAGDGMLRAPDAWQQAGAW